jgi:hypothetical protein
VYEALSEKRFAGLLMNKCAQTDRSISNLFWNFAAQLP